VIRTVVAVTAPVLAAGPKALTQSPTARALAETDWVAFRVVELEVVTLRVWVLGVVGFLVLVLDLVFFELRVKLPGERVMPESVTVDPLTPVTLPDATESEANCLRKLLAPAPPPGKLGRVPPPKPAPPRNWEPPDAETPPPPAPRAPNPVHEPLELAVVTVMVRAAIVVLELFDAVPVAEMQSPGAKELTASDTVLENAVVGVQLTVVWPELAFCTSMLEALSAATLPLAPAGAFGVVAAPADVAAAAT